MQAKDILKNLIQIPSTSGSEGEIQQWIYEYLEGLKLKPEWIGPNIAVQLAGKDRSKCLIFNGHVDTVSPGNEKDWQYGPWNPKIVGDKMYGLGASDMKSGVTVMLFLIDKYSKIQSPIDLWFCFVIQEETDGSGTKEIMEWFEKNHFGETYTSLAGILAEPTSLSLIEIAHKGNIFLELKTHGDGGHGSEPEKQKKHAVKEMLKAENHVTKLVQKWAKSYSDKILGNPTIVMTSIAAGSGESPNKIADTCTATFDLRTTPQLHKKAFSLIKKELAFFPDVVAKPVYDGLPPGYTDANEHIVQIAKKVTGLPIGTTPGSTDMLFFTAVKIPAIIFGPGEKSMEHRVNEYVKLSNLEKCLVFYTKIIQEF